MIDIKNLKFGDIVRYNRQDARFIDLYYEMNEQETHLKKLSKAWIILKNKWGNYEVVCVNDFELFSVNSEWEPKFAINNYVNFISKKIIRTGFVEKIPKTKGGYYTLKTTWSNEKFKKKENCITYCETQIFKE